MPWNCPLRVRRLLLWCVTCADWVHWPPIGVAVASAAVPTRMPAKMPAVALNPARAAVIRAVRVVVMSFSWVVVAALPAGKSTLAAGGGLFRRLVG